MTEYKGPYYTTIIKEAVEGLNLHERGLYEYMRGQSENYRFNVGVLAKELKSTVYKIRKTLRGLITQGIIQRIESRTKGFIQYLYKVFDKKVEVRDDAMKMRKTIEDTAKVITKTVEIPSEKTVVEKEKIKEHRKKWVDLFKGNEDLIQKFISNRKKHLATTTYYQQRGGDVMDAEVEKHIDNKLNEANSTMEGIITEFIKTELTKRQAKVAEEVSTQTITEYRRLEIELREKVLAEKAALSKEKYPDLWARRPELVNREWTKEKKELEINLATEFIGIEEKYNEIYKPLLEQAKK
jgi:predicted transcriptional regulator